MRWRIFARRSTAIEARELFDFNWFTRTYELGSLTADEAWSCYLASPGQLDPAPWFSTADYLVDHPDVARAGIDPFSHYVAAGRLEGRHIRASRHVARAQFVPEQVPEVWVGDWESEPNHRAKSRPVDQDPARLARSLVDENFYFAAYPDVTSSGLSAAMHYEAYGWCEGRDPSPWFSTSYYLRSNPDVAASGMNPLVHYVSAGRRERRLSRDPLGDWRQQVMSERSVLTQARSWVREGATIRLDQDTLMATLRSALSSCTTVNLIVASDDSASNFGGVQACVATQATSLSRRGVTVLRVWPVQPLPIATRDPDYGVHLTIGEEQLPPVAMADLVRSLRDPSLQSPEWTVSVHGLLGHNLSVVASLAGAVADAGGRTEWWAHDYFAACSNYTLSPNSVAYCGAPPPNSMKCQVCAHGAERSHHLRGMRELLGSPGLTVVAPSESAAKVWLHGTGADVPTEVRPIGRFSPLGHRRRNPNAPLRLAFIGMPLAHKGWLDFLELRRWVLGRRDVQLFHIGTSDQELAGLQFVAVQQKGGETQAMIAALRDHEIDVVFHWPTWPETFGITAHEAIAAGCLVVTNTGSGNIAALANITGQVMVLDVDALSYVLRRGRFIGLLQSRLAQGTSWGEFDLLPDAFGRVEQELAQ